MRNLKIFILLFAVFSLAGCNTNPTTNTVSFVDQTINVFEEATINPTFSGEKEDFTVSYEGKNIRIINNKITGLNSGTSTDVTLTTESGLETTFRVDVTESTYQATNNRDVTWADDEGWFNSTKVSEVSNLSQDFIHGIDISSIKALYENGTKFFNSNGKEQSVFQILKEAGFNWIRVKLWVDPISSNGISYGGGDNDLDRTTWILKEAKYEGFRLLLDLHYSDYWTHPGHQILPKAWKDVSSPDELAEIVKQYTVDTLNSLREEGCLPDMVQLGNEVSSGMFLQYPNLGDETLDINGEPTYNKSATDYEHKALPGSDNMSKYLQAGVEGVKAVSDDIKTVIHWAKSQSISASAIKNFFNSITADYDYAAISYYPYYCFDTIEEGRQILNGLSDLGKPWFIAETSYPFSGSSYVEGVTNFAVSNWSKGTDGITSIYQQYPFTPAGQAHMIHDLTEATVDAGGLGIFYWEGAWIPNENVGWAGSGSTNSWGNQGFFSYDGKAIANLDLFAQMSKYI